MLSVIIPTYNEDENIETIVILLSKVLRRIDYELIICDDNSSDNTIKVIKQLSGKFPVRLLLREGSRGLSLAVIDGFKSAKGDILCVMDADMSHPPESIPEMLSKIEKEGFDLVVASRYVNGSVIIGWSIVRKISSYISSIFSRPLTSITDPLSGFFMLTKPVIENLNLKVKGYKILLEILVRGNYEKVSEVPFVFKNRKFGCSKLTLKVRAQFIMQLLRLYLFKIKNFLIV